MRLDPDDALFPARAAVPRALGRRAALLATALVANAWMARPLPLLLLGLAGVLALGVDRAGRARFERLLAGLASALLFAFVPWLLTGSSAGTLPVVLRLSSGLAWVIWFGGAASWPALRVGARRLQVPEALIELVDTSVAHGLLLLREIGRRDEAVAVRLGLALRRDRFAFTGGVLAGGVERAFDRAVILEESRTLRTAGSAAPSAPALALDLDGASAGHAGAAVALDRITLALSSSRWLAVAGPSGSGKTTLLRLAAGLLTPTAGTVRRLGVDLVRSPARARLDGRVGMVFQDPEDQLFGSTPLEDVAFGLRSRGAREAESIARAHAMLAELAIDHLADRPVHQLSFGERKRVAFAAVLVCEPALLLCDEPTIGLDPVAARRLVRVVERVALARNTAVVWVTHDLAALPAPIDRVLLLAAGRVSFDGPRDEALDPARLAASGLAWDALCDDDEQGG